MSFVVDYELGLLKRHQNSHSFAPSGCGEHDRVCVQELNTSTFHEVVMDEGKVRLNLRAHVSLFLLEKEGKYVNLLAFYSVFMVKIQPQHFKTKMKYLIWPKLGSQ